MFYTRTMLQEIEKKNIYVTDYSIVIPIPLFIIWL